MTDVNEQSALPLKQATNRSPLWLAVIWVVLGLPALAFSAFFGYSTAYCDSAGNALGWVLFFSIWAATTVFMDYLPNVWSVLVACTAIALLARCLQRVKVTWIRFLVALPSIYLVAAIVARLLDSHGSCRIM